MWRSRFARHPQGMGGSQPGPRGAGQRSAVDLVQVSGMNAHPVRSVLVGVVKVYRLFFRAWLGNRCRFEPTCSQYAIEALQRHGAVSGSLLAAGRVLRCHPWCEAGVDPVPDHAASALPGVFSRLGLVPSRHPEAPSPIRNLP